MNTYVYLLQANIVENELLHFYIPAEKVTKYHHEILTSASDPNRDEKFIKLANKFMFKHWEYMTRTGTRKCNISHTYCISFMA